MEQLDQQVVALAKAIREHETGNRAIQGGSGELASRYQFLPATWKAGAKKYLGDENAPLTLENENKVAYSQIKEWKDKGYNPGQIAAAWNAGEGSLAGDRWKTMQGTNKYGVNYDVPKYVDSVYANYEKFKPRSTEVTTQPKEQKGLLASILSTPASAATSAYNLIKSAPTLARGVAQQLTGDIAGANMSGRIADAEINRERNIPLLGKTAPLYNTQDTTGQMIKKTIGAGAELASYGIGGQAAANIVKGGLRGAAAKIGAGALEGAFGGAIGAGGQAAAQDKTAGEIGQATLSGAAFGGAIGGIGAGIPVVASALGKYVPQSVKFALGKASGLDKSTLETGLKYTDELAAARKSGLTRETIGKKVEGAVDNIIKDVSETGRAYEPIRNSGAVVEIPTNYWRDKLDALGVKIKNGVVDRKSSKVMTSADSKAINEFLQIYAKEGQVSADDFLRTREALANVAKYDSAKSTVSSNISKSLREGVNTDFRSSIPGLENLDAQYAPLKEMLREIRGKVVDKQGEVKLSSIVNSLKAGRTNQLKTLEKLSPGITKELQILSAVEDIAIASEKNKIGAYAQSILFGGGFLAGGLPGAVVGLLASNPNLVMDVIQYYAKSSAFLRKNLSTALPKIANGIKPNAVEAKAIQNAIEQEIKNPVVLAGLLPEKAGPDAVPKLPISLPGKGILESQANLKAKNIAAPAKENLVASQKAAGIFKGTKDLGQTRISDISKFEKAEGLAGNDRIAESKFFQKILKEEDNILADYKAKNKNIVNTDDFRRYSEDYKGYNAAAVQEPASYLAKRAYTENLKNEGKYAVLYAGGSGSGKTSAIKNLPEVSAIIDNSAVIFDGNLSGYSSAVKRMEEAANAGKEAPIVYVYRDPVDAFVNGVVKRMKTNESEMGRLVPTKVTAKNHIDSWEVVNNLSDDGAQVYFIDNSLGAGNSRLSTRQELTKKIKYPSEKELTSMLNKEAKRLFDAGEITREEYLGYLR